MPATAAFFHSRISGFPSSPVAPMIITFMFMNSRESSFEGLGIAQSDTALIFRGDDGIGVKFPLDIQLGVVPHNGPFALRSIVTR